jgi:hypothetical protein
MHQISPDWSPTRMTDQGCAYMLLLHQLLRATVSTWKLDHSHQASACLKNNSGQLHPTKQPDASHGWEASCWDVGRGSRTPHRLQAAPTTFTSCQSKTKLRNVIKAFHFLVSNEKLKFGKKFTYSNFMTRWWRNRQSSALARSIPGHSRAPPPNPKKGSFDPPLSCTRTTQHTRM